MIPDSPVIQARPTKPVRRASRSAFSLLEVMISILILALGLLGILAAYPSVIELQRRAQDDVLGDAAASAAEAYIRNAIWDNEQPVENDPDINFFDPTPPRDMLRLDLGLSTAGFPAIVNGAAECLMTYEWAWEADYAGRNMQLPPEVDGGLGSFIHASNVAQSRLINRGSLVLGNGLNAARFAADAADNAINAPVSQLALDVLEIPVSARLFPEPGSGSEPRYVWDAVFRRVDAGLERPSAGFITTQRFVRANDLQNLPVQAAIFVRRIDPGITVPPEIPGDERFTRAEAISGFLIETTGPGAQQPGTRLEAIDPTLRRVPVSAIAGDGVDTILPYPSQPTLDGKVSVNGGVFQGYSPILGLPITVDPDGTGDFDIVEFSEPLPGGVGGGALAPFPLRREAGKPRQILVDNAGGIRRVVEPLDANDPGGVAFENNAPVRVRVDPPYSAGDALGGGLTQAVFTPQIPVSARVIELRP
ncbi:MAG: prepilin-type N-terminal cleavage/methylation domain-containing protein [Planctomycetota bacterium]